MVCIILHEEFLVGGRQIQLGLSPGSVARHEIRVLMTLGAIDALVETGFVPQLVGGTHDRILVQLLDDGLERGAQHLINDVNVTVGGGHIALDYGRIYTATFNGHGDIVIGTGYHIEEQILTFG